MMNKKQFLTLTFSLIVTMSIYAQKNEVKAAEKAVKKQDYSAALAALSQAESSIGNADAKLQAKYYYFKGVSLYQAGAGTDIDGVIASFNSLKEVEKKSGNSNYTNDALGIINDILVKIDGQAFAAYQEGMSTKNPDSFKEGAKQYEKVFLLSPADTSGLYKAALLNGMAKEYEKSNEQYQQLIDMGYTGITKVFKATSVVDGTPRTYPTKKQMDSEVRLKIAKDPVVDVTESKYISMIKSVASNYLGLDNNEKALEFIKKARSQNPKDYNLIIEEGNIYYKMGDMEMFKSKLEEAISVNPTNPNLYYNVGILNSELGDLDAAEKSLKKSIELDPENPNAYNALGNIILTRSESIQKELDKNAMNFKKYDEIKVNKLYPILREAMPYIEKSYELEKDDVVRNQLNSIYENLGMDKRVD